jgi:hypothetical protein
VVRGVWFSVGVAVVLRWWKECIRVGLGVAARKKGCGGSDEVLVSHMKSSAEHMREGSNGTSQQCASVDLARPRPKPYRK